MSGADLWAAADAELDASTSKLATPASNGPLARAVAEVESECDECGSSIAAGDPIVLAVEGGPWVHRRCGP